MDLSTTAEQPMGRCVRAGQQFLHTSTASGASAYFHCGTAPGGDSRPGLLGAKREQALHATFFHAPHGSGNRTQLLTRKRHRVTHLGVILEILELGTMQVTRIISETDARSAAVLE